MRQKRILLLGGAESQMPSIVKAKAMGLYVITCDYLPDNPGHRLADEYHNVSTTDLEGVYRLAKSLDVDGILCYASDPSAPAAAYAAERLGLPGSPYRSVDILTHKDKFRAFLREHGFNVPRAKGYSTLAEAQADLGNFRLPVMVKPTDSAGSKGVALLSDPVQLPALVENALKNSREKRFVVEEFVEKDGYQVAGDVFSVDGRLVFDCFMDDHFCERNLNPYVPVAASCPMNRPPEQYERLRKEVARLIEALQMKTQAYNLDARFDRNGEPWIMELGPRNGGNMIAQVIEHATGVPYVEWMIRAALGEDLGDMRQRRHTGFWAYYAIHAHRTGIFKGVTYKPQFKKHIVEEHLYLRRNDPIGLYTGSNGTAGILIMNFDSQDQMYTIIREAEKMIEIEIASKPLKVLVFGATGRLGGYSALALKAAGHAVVACGRRKDDNGFFSSHGCQYIGGVVLEDKATFECLPTDVDVVVNLAGAMPAHADADPMPYVQSIVVGMTNVLEWMRRGSCRRIVFNTTPSDVSAFFGGATPVEDDAPRSFPKDGGDHAVYAICKNAAVDLLEHYRIAHGFKPIIFRHLTVYCWHPNATYFLNGVKKVLPWRQIMRRCISGAPIEVWGDPKRKKELLYIDDFTDAVKRAVETDVCGLFNLPGFRPYTLEEQIQGLIDVFAKSDAPPQKIMCPDKPSTPQNLLQGMKAERFLGWKAKVSWPEACRRLLKSIQENPFGPLWGAVDSVDCV